MTIQQAGPVQGQLVEVRSRRFVVTEVAESELAAGPAIGLGGARQHRASLSTVTDEGTREELEVVWGLEPGARVHERAALPEVAGVDDPARLDAILNALRRGALALGSEAVRRAEPAALPGQRQLPRAGGARRVGRLSVRRASGVRSAARTGALAIAPIP